MGHYAVRQRGFNSNGQYYLHREGLTADLVRVLGLLNLGEDTENITRTTWRYIDGEEELPHMRVSHAVLGDTYLPEAIDYFRNQKGVGSFPFVSVPSAAEWGTGSWKEGVNMRWVVELLEAVGRGVGASGPRRVYQLRSNKQGSNETPVETDALTQSTLNEIGPEQPSVTLQSSVRGGNISLGGGVWSSNTYFHDYKAKAFDTQIESGQSNLSLNDWELANQTKIIQTGLGSGGSASGGISIGDVSQYSAYYYDYTPTQTIPNYETPEGFHITNTSILALVGRSDAIPATIGDALDTVGATSGRYVILMPPIDLDYVKSGVVTYTYDNDFFDIPDVDAQQSWVYNGIWNMTIGLPGGTSGISSWLFWTEPVLPNDWPADTYTAP